MKLKFTPKQVRKLWAKDLRDNPDKQGYGKLLRKDSNGEKYCCLGRLVLLFKSLEPEQWTEDLEKHLLVGVSLVEAPIVMKWAGLKGCNGSFTPDRETLRALYKTYMNHRAKACLARGNDCGATFSEIADVIDAEPNDLFVD